MKYTKTIQVDFYVCDEEFGENGDYYTCKKPATELFRNNKTRHELHFCIECPALNPGLTENYTYMGKIK